MLSTYLLGNLKAFSCGYPRSLGTSTCRFIFLFLAGSSFWGNQSCPWVACSIWGQIWDYPEDVMHKVIFFSHPGSQTPEIDKFCACQFEGVQVTLSSTPSSSQMRQKQSSVEPEIMWKLYQHKLVMNDQPQCTSGIQILKSCEACFTIISQLRDCIINV